ncbi:MAG: nucleotidyltransferase family protein [Rhizobiaceae bacterium]|nr:nucleotidyltransferase family protein [Rhizobiaceae bacterium]
MSDIAAIILAAGQSKRMGAQNKLLAMWQDKPLLQHVCEAVSGSACSQMIIVTGHEQAKVNEAVKQFNVTIAHNDDYATGMASSIKAGIQRAAAGGCEAVIILLGDMPEITTSMINQLIWAGDKKGKDAIIVAACEGKRGNPVLWPRRYFDELQRLDGDQGARQIMGKFEGNIVEVELGKAARYDLDTPEAFGAGGN